MTDASEARAHRCGASIENPQDEDTSRQGSAHTTGGDPFHPFLVGLHPSPPAMETRGYLGGDRLDLELQNVCDRSEDGLASVEPLLPVLFSQPASPFR